MNRTFILFPNPGVQFYAVSDQSSGGDSAAVVYIEDDSLWLECTIRPLSRWPYCQVDFSFGSTYQEGLRGDKYNKIHLRIEHRGPKPNETLRVFLRGYNDAFSQPGHYNTLMPNQIEYRPNRYPEGLTLELEHFIPATWWLSEMELPIHQQKPTFKRIPLIQISTGSLVSQGDHTIRIREVSLQGKWIQADLLYSILLALWVLTTFYWSLRQAWTLRSSLANEQRRRHELEQLNSFLELSNQQLENQAYHDDLTRLRNRAGLRDILYEAVQESKKNNQSLSLMFMDIDHFKHINDNYGHAMGDEVLRKFARTLRSQVRVGDTLVRWGGEEFLLLCPDTTLEQACALAEKLRQCIEVEVWSHGQALACSFGVAELEGNDPRATIEIADQALYRAKNSGRNQVVAASGETFTVRARSNKSSTNLDIKSPTKGRA